MALGFAIIGCGSIAEFHARAIADLKKKGRLVACYSATPASADRFAAAHGCQAYHQLDALLADPAVDVVNICSPSGAHLEPAVAAAKAGKHVVVEKPLEITLKRCDAIIEACRKAGVKLCTIFPSRFSPANLALKRAIDEGRFGQITLADTYVKWWRDQRYYDSGGWRGTWDLDGGGAYMNQAIHNVDLMLWLMGDVAEVTAQTATLAHERIEVEDVGVANVRYASGALGVLEATTSAWPGLLKKTEIHGTMGSAIVEQDSVLLWQFSKTRKSDETLRAQLAPSVENSGGAADPKAIKHTGHLEQLKDFVKAIESGGTPRVDGAEGRRSVELILAIYQSAWTGKRIALPLARDPRRPSA